MWCLSKCKNKKSTKGLARKNATPIKFDQKSSEAQHDQPFFKNFEKCLPEVADDAISGVAVDQRGMDVRVKLGYSRLNSGRIIRLFGQPDPLYALSCSIYCILQPTGSS